MQSCSRAILQSTCGLAVTPNLAACCAAVAVFSLQILLFCIHEGYDADALSKLHPTCRASPRTEAREPTSSCTCLQAITEGKCFATMLWGEVDVVVDVGGKDGCRKEFLLECAGLQVSCSPS